MGTVIDLQGGRGAGADQRPWYVTAAIVVTRPVGSAFVSRPASTVHAKRMGTITTACGLSAYSWRKLLDVAFPLCSRPLDGAEVCRKCLKIVVEDCS